MTKRRIHVFAFAAVLVAAIATLIPALKASGKDSGDPVVAVVNGKEIHKSQVVEFTENLPPQVRQAQPEQIYPLVIDQLINTELLSSEARKAGLEEDKEVLKQLAEAKEQIIRNAYLERKIAKLLTDDKLKKEYDKFVAENKDKMEVHARHILVKTEDEAKAVVKQLKEGADFSTLAKEKSVGPTGQNGGDLGYFGEDAMVPEFSKAVFAAKPGQLIETPIQTQFGWHVVYVEDKRKQQLPEFEQLKPALKNKLGQEALETVLADIRKDAKVERFTIDGQPLDAAKEGEKKEEAAPAKE